MTPFWRFNLHPLKGVDYDTFKRVKKGSCSHACQAWTRLPFTDIASCKYWKDIVTLRRSTGAVLLLNCARLVSKLEELQYRARLDVGWPSGLYFGPCESSVHDYSMNTHVYVVEMAITFLVLEKKRKFLGNCYSECANILLCTRGDKAL